MTTKKILTTMPNDGRPYVLESAAFRMSVHQYRQDAQREIDALDGEISRLQAELEARMSCPHSQGEHACQPPSLNPLHQQEREI